MGEDEHERARVARCPSVSSGWPLTLGLALGCLTACAMEGGEPGTPVLASPSASARVAAATPAVTAEPTAPVEPLPAEPPVAAPAAEPEPPRPPNAEPASLQLAFHGKCDHIDVSTVDDQTFVHYRSKSGEQLVRLDGRGEVAQTYPFGDALGYHTSIERVLGHWPDQLLVLIETEAREDVYGSLYRLANGQWQPVETLGSDADYDGAWPWVDGSILALADKGLGGSRGLALAVVRGEGKGPSLAKLKRVTKCPPDELYVTDVAVLADGTVMALAYCDDTWLVTWPPGQPHGTVTLIPIESHGWGSLHVDDHGHGFVVASTDVVRVGKGKPTVMELPGGRGDAKVDGRRGLVWVIRGDTLWRATDDSWEVVPTPGGRRLDAVAGLELGTPWLLFTDGTVAMQTVDGAWHDAPLPPVSELTKAPKATLLDVTAPGDAWVRATYLQPRGGSKRGKTKMRALYTSRPEPTARQCDQPR